MSENFQWDIFLSYSRKDTDVVRPLAERLRGDGLRVWFDEWEVKPGDSIPAKIDEGLEGARVLILCMSANAFGSDWARLESYTFRFRDPLNKERRLIPVRLDEAPVPGTLAQFQWISWHSADGQCEYPKLLAACRGEVSLRWSKQVSKRAQPKASPEARGKLVQIMHSGSGDIVIGNKSVGRQRTVFTPGPQHITPETSGQLKDLVKQIVERLTVSGTDAGKVYKTVWGAFNKKFALTTYRELPHERTEEAISYLKQWRASKNAKLRFADPEKFRTAQLRSIWWRAKVLGLTPADLYAFAARKLALSSAVASLNDLGNQHLARLSRFLIYEERKVKQASRRS